MVKKITILDALEPFLVNPNEKLHLASISRELKEPHPTVRLWLNKLEKLGILKKGYQGRLTLYYLNLENPIIIDYIVMAEKGSLVRKCEKWPVLGELVSFMHRNLSESSRALVFGSAVDSFAAANDIDILIVGKDNSKKIGSFGKKLGKETHIINVKNLNKVSKALRLEIIKKHLLIKGSEDFVRWMLWQQ